MDFKKSTVFILAIFITACGEDLPPATSASTCSNNAVVIQVMDGFLRSDCGCNEGVQTVSNGTNFSCTFNAGKTVFFFSNGIQTQHQIQIQNVFTGPAWDGVTNKNVQTFGITISTAGSYNLIDLFYPQATGTLTAL